MSTSEVSASVLFVNLFGFLRTNVFLLVEQTSPPVGSVAQVVSVEEPPGVPTTRAQTS